MLMMLTHISNAMADLLVLQKKVQRAIWELGKGPA